MRKNDFDTKLIIYRSRQVFIVVATIILAGIFAVILAQNASNGFPWYALVFPMTGLGLLLLPVPPTEEWEYKPWQGKARQVEQQER